MFKKGYFQNIIMRLWTESQLILEPILKSSFFFPQKKKTRSRINECGMSTLPFNFLEFSFPAFPFNIQYFLWTHWADFTTAEVRSSPHPHGRKLFRVHPTPTNHKSHLHNVENGQGVFFFSFKSNTNINNKSYFYFFQPSQCQVKGGIYIWGKVQLTFLRWKLL